MKLKFTLRAFLLVALIFSSSVLFAQKQRLFVQSARSSLFIDHKVQPKETFNAIASFYNIAPDTLSEYNNMDYYDGELLAKNLKIPLRAGNFYQKGLTDSLLAFIPVYHLTKSSQTVQQISAQFNKVPVASLKLWNGIPKTGIVSGMQVLVGYLKVQPGLIAYFEEATPYDIAVVEKPKVVVPKPEIKIDSAALVVKEETKVKEEPKVETPKPKKGIDSTAIAKADKKVKDKSKDVVTKPKEEVKEEPKVKTGKPGEEIIKEPKAETPKPFVAKKIHVGFFQDIYRPSIPKEKVITGDAAVFESTSGWQDGKYYILIPKLKPGSIVKISFANKILYAKVLGDMPFMDENKDLLLRLSNSAANELGVKDAKFPVVVTY
jgi:hypothetical protein